MSYNILKPVKGCSRNAGDRVSESLDFNFLPGEHSLSPALLTFSAFDLCTKLPAQLLGRQI